MPELYAWTITWGYTLSQSSPTTTFVVAPTLACATVLAHQHPVSGKVVYAIACCGHRIDAVWQAELSVEELARRELAVLLDEEPLR